MFWSRTYSSLKDLEANPSAPYGQQVRAAHALADLLKRTHPHLHEQIDGLQINIIHNQQLLMDIQAQMQTLSAAARKDNNSVDQDMLSNLASQERTAFQNLDDTMQSLLDIRHKGRF